MAAVIGWCGPLIDLCKASSHIEDYVQLIVFVHKCTPVQYKIARNGGEVVRMDILVGDETRSYFPVTIWQKEMRSKILAGHVFLLQNLKITRFGDTVEARTLHFSYMQCLLSSKDFADAKGVEEVVRDCRVGASAKEKLQKVVGWMQRARLTHCGSVLNDYEHGRQLKINWKVPEEAQTQECLSLSELCLCEDSGKATFHASVGEIFLPITWISLDETEAERMFISRRIHILGEKSLVDDLITTGCQLCGSPVNAEHGTNVKQNPIPLYCQRSLNRLHIVGTIYRPFLLYVWDDSNYVPVLVIDKAARFLFANISAEKVYSAYRRQRQKQLLDQNHMAEIRKDSFPVHAGIACATRNEISNPCSSSTDGKNPNFYMIWLVLLKTLFQHGKNSPMKFKVMVDTNKDWESGRLEMISVSMPAYRRNYSS